MLPGLWPTLLMAGLDPIRAASVSPPMTTWSGAAPNYSSALEAVHEGGYEPFMYAWSTTGGDAVVVNPSSKVANLTSVSGFPASVDCIITDAMGQSILVSGFVNQPF